MSGRTHAIAMALLFCGRVWAAEHLPVDTFSRQFTYDTVEISPGGNHLAASYLRADDEQLAVIDLASNKATVVSSVKKPDLLLSMWWKSDERLIYQLFLHGDYGSQYPVLFASNADGSRRVPLTFGWRGESYIASDQIVDVDWEEPDSILLASDAKDDENPVVYRTDVEKFTGGKMALAGEQVWPTQRKALFKVPGHDCQYMTDNAGVVRTCVTDEAANTGRLLYRSGDGADWVELARIAFGDVLSPVGFTADNKQLYVISNVGRNTRALFLYDPQRKAIGEKLFEAEGLDVENAVYGGDGRKLIAVTYSDKLKRIFYLDRQLGAIHQSLSKTFPGQQVQLASFSRDNRKIVVLVGDSSTPGAFYLYDRDKAEIRKLTDVAPWIIREKMAITHAVEFDARDGVHINGYLTLPRDGPDKGLPLIVNVHGGPHGVRNRAQFDRETQLFANRGYAVLQVNFRGSGGYGREFLDAGHHEWGRKMQTDLEDGVKWLVARGTVDPARVGIFGGSYGGYATMMALITAPDMFKCGVTYAGVSNLSRLLNSRTFARRAGGWRVITEDERLYWESVIGDRHDEAALKEISPLFNVEKIKAPVFIAHGMDDLTVPFVEATDLERALRRAGKTVETLYIPHEGHGFFNEKNRRTFYERLDAFFAKNLPAS